MDMSGVARRSLALMHMRSVDLHANYSNNSLTGPNLARQNSTAVGRDAMTLNAPYFGFPTASQDAPGARDVTRLQDFHVPEIMVRYELG